MKKFSSLWVGLLLWCLATLPSFGTSFTVRQAQIAYDSAQYQQAVEIYDSIAQHMGVSPALNYNLGNAYYKLRNFPKAILHYERCLLADPSATDAAENLELARLQCVDKIEAIQPPFFTVWSDNLRDVFSCDTWGLWALITFLLCIAGCGLYFFGLRPARRKVGFYGALVSFAVCLVCLHYASERLHIMEAHEYAIVMTPAVVVRSSPATSGTQLFTIHEGLKVRVRSTLSGWSEIELADGNVGWLPSEDIERI